MATTLTTSYQTIASGNLTWSYDGTSYTVKVEVQAKYSNQSGNAATLDIRERATLTSPSGWTWYGSNKYRNLNGGGWVQDTSNLVTGTAHEWSTSISNVAGGSSKSVSAGYRVMSNEKSVSGSVVMPTFATPPTGLAASNVVATKNSFSATVSITGWGNAATDARYRELQVWTYNASSFVEPRRYKTATGTALSSTITCNNSSSGSLTITPNTRYTLGVYANNGNAATGSQRVGDYVTLPDELTNKAVGNIQPKSITITAKTKADGNYYAKEIQYSLNNSTWTTGATVSSGSVTNVSFNITGLTPGTNYTIYLRVKTTAGTASCGSLTAKTKSVVKIVRISGGATQVIDALPYVIKPDGTKKELKINYVRQ